MSTKPSSPSSLAPADLSAADTDALLAELSRRGAVSDGPSEPRPLPSRRWMSVEDIRKEQRCRRQAVLAAMDAGALLYEQRGRARYARVEDVRAWEEARLRRPSDPVGPGYGVHPALARFAL